MPGPYDTHTTADILVKDYAAEIANKVVLTTGCSPGGLGAFFVQQIAAASPSLLILAGRNPSKITATAKTIENSHPNVQVRTLQLDLESLAAVREAADEVNGWEDVPAIDVLVNNAGIMACEYAKTGDGLEKQFATGHVGPFLFTNLIMGKLLQAGSPRVVNVASDGHRTSQMRWPDIGFSVKASPSPLPCVCERTFCPQESRLMEFRTASYTTNGAPTARPRLQTCSWPFLWLRSWEIKASRPFRCTRG